MEELNTRGIDIVITSYSIHYTKLYDPVLLIVAGGLLGYVLFRREAEA